MGINKFSIGLFACLVLPFLLHGAVKTDDEIRTKYPYALLDTDTIDLGKVKAGQQLRPSFSISNTGAHDLLIAKVRSSCGLMIPTWPVEPIKPGKAATIHFRYDSNRLGPFVRHVVIHTNAWQKTLIVTVKGEITP